MRSRRGIQERAKWQFCRPVSRVWGLGLWGLGEASSGSSTGMHAGQGGRSYTEWSWGGHCGHLPVGRPSHLT